MTDLPIRRMNYPTPDPSTTRGVLLASYTWGQDALPGCHDPETRLEEALDDVARIHPRIRDEYEVGTSYAWYADRWARGAFALFAPEQQTELQADIVEPKGGSTSPASTARSTTPGSRVPWSRDPGGPDHPRDATGGGRVGPLGRSIPAGEYQSVMRPRNGTRPTASEPNLYAVRTA